jgi:hypothetical protein
VTIQDSSDLGGGPIDVVVHDHVVEPVGGGLFGVGPGETPLHDGGVVLAPLEQTAPLLLSRRRLHEHEHRVREGLLDGERALDVDLERDVVAAGEVLLHRRARRPVEVSVDVEPLEELTVVTLVLELRTVEEEVLATVDLSVSTGARGRRDREPKPRVALEELPDDGPLADPGRARDDQQDAQGVPPISRSA